MQAKLALVREGPPQQENQSTYCIGTIYKAGDQGIRTKQRDPEGKIGTQHIKETGTQSKNNQVQGARDRDLEDTNRDWQASPRTQKMGRGQETQVTAWSGQREERT